MRCIKPIPIHTCAGNIISEIRDHYINFLIIKRNKPPTHDYANRPAVRSFNKENKIKFFNLIKNVSFHEEYFSNDVDNAFEIFQNKLSVLFNEAFPLTQISRKNYRDEN